MKPEVRIVDNIDQLYELAAEEFLLQAQAAVATSGRYAVALSGGATPLGLFQLLADEPPYQNLPWSRTHVFWGDERHVPPDHPDSNYRMAKQVLLDHVGVPEAQVHRIRGEFADADEAAREYEQTLRSFFGDGAMPRFDFALMGLGTDGHTASLFPHSPALTEMDRLVVANRTVLGERITLTAPVFNHCHCALFLVAGAAKAQAVHAVLEGPRDPDTWPAQLIAPIDGRLLWLVDQAAASLLLR